MKRMSNDEFMSRITTEGELAFKRISDFLEKGDVDAFYANIDARYIDPEDLEFVKLLLADAMRESLQTDISNVIPSKCQVLMDLMLVLQFASEAAKVHVVQLCHQLRKEADYSGLSLLYDACTADLPFKVYQDLGDMVYNDHYSAELLTNRTESVLYALFLDEIGLHQEAIIDEATAAWDHFLTRRSDEEDNDEEDNDEDTELTYDRFMSLLCYKDETDVDIPRITDPYERIVKTCSFLMTFAEAATDIFAEYASELRSQKDYGDINSVLTYLWQQPHSTYDDYCYFCSIVMGDVEDGAKE